jgi:LPXTG-site transpeptidase (sortase) family protein
VPEKIKSGIAKGLRGLKTLPLIIKINKRGLLFLLCGLSAALLIAAAAVGLSIYSEGQTAGKEARKLLMEYEQALESSELTALADDAYVQPEKPGVEPENTFNAVKTLSGYQVIGKLTIQKISVELPVISHLDEKALKVSVCYYKGALPGETGNMIIAGHNYANGMHFGKLDELTEDDAVIFEAPDGTSYRYEVYDSLVVKPDNVEALEECEAQSELTLLTCTSQGNRRHLVRCRMDDE